MLGSHLSIAGGLHNALLMAEQLHCETVQIFTKNQQQWRVPPLSPLIVEQWKTHSRRLGFTKTVAHDSYLINLGSPDDAMWRLSIDVFTQELIRCDALGIAYLVAHPGATWARARRPAWRASPPRWMSFTRSFARSE